MKKILLFVTIYLLILNSGFSQTEQSDSTIQIIENVNDTLSQQKLATIFFKRQWSLLGAVVRHFVIDKGDSLNLNSIIFEKESFPSDKFNFYKSRNVKRLYLKLNSKIAGVLLSYPPVEGLTIIDGSKIYTNKVKLSLLKYLQRNPVYMINAESMRPNANLVATVGSGETIEWKRPEGIMQLQVVVPDGTQIFGKSFYVEAGKSYNVGYSYVRSKFVIKEYKGESAPKKKYEKVDDPNY